MFAVAGGDLSNLKFSSGGGLTQGVVLTAATPTTTTTVNSLHSSDNMGEEANRKREVRLLKNRYFVTYSTSNVTLYTFRITVLK